MSQEKRWTVEVEQAGDELVLPFPEDLLQTVGWQEGDTLRWNVEDSGTITITKVNDGKD